MAGIRRVVDVGSDTVGVDLAQLDIMSPGNRRAMESQWSSAMNTCAIRAGQAALALALATRTSDTQSVSDSGQARAGCLPFIGAGTFLVAAYLGSSFCTNLVADRDPAHPVLSARTTRLR